MAAQTNQWLWAPAAALTAVGAAVGMPAPVYAASYLTIEQAQRLMFADASSFQDVSLRLTPEQLKAVEMASGVRPRSAEVRAFAARAGERLLGHVLVDEVIGKVELITYAVAFEPDGTIRQVEILAYRETHGGEVRNAAWRKQFAGKKALEQLRFDEDIKNITGATLSSRHITEGVRRLVAAHRLLLAAGK